MPLECAYSQEMQIPKHVYLAYALYQEDRAALLAAAGSSSQGDLTQTRRGLLVMARQLIQKGVLDQFLLAKEEKTIRLVRIDKLRGAEEGERGTQ